MNRTFQLVVWFASLVISVNSSLAQEAVKTAKSTKPPASTVALPAGITEEMLAPPPVPRFMLEKPAKPLTTDEMVQQARDAEIKAGVGRKDIDKKVKIQTQKP